MASGSNRNTFSASAATDRPGEACHAEIIQVVIVDLPTPVPISNAEVEAIENYLGALLDDYIAPASGNGSRGTTE